MAQFLRPDQDIADNSWTENGAGTDLYAVLDESTYDDADYITSPSASGTYTTQIGLSSGDDPVSSINHTIRWRARYAGSGSNTLATRIYLYQGATLKATSTQYSEGSSFAGHSYTLSSSEADSITNYADLIVYIEAIVAGAGSRNANVSWLEFEIPDAPGSTTHDGTATLSGTSSLTVDATSITTHSATTTLTSNSELLVLGSTATNGVATLSANSILTVAGLATITHNATTNLQLSSTMIIAATSSSDNTGIVSVSLSSVVLGQTKAFGQNEIKGRVERREGT